MYKCGNTFWTSHNRHHTHDLEENEQTLGRVIERVVLVQQLNVHFHILRTNIQMGGLLCVSLSHLGQSLLVQMVVLHELTLIGIQRSPVRLIATVRSSEMHFALIPFAIFRVSSFVSRRLKL